MPPTRSFKDTVAARARRDPAFRVGMLTEAIDLFLQGDLATGKALLRDYINASVGFQALGEALEKSPKSLMRMLSDAGNPRADSFLAIISSLQRLEGLTFTVQATARGEAAAAE